MSDQFWFSYSEETKGLTIGLRPGVCQTKPLREWWRLAMPPSKPYPACNGSGVASDLVLVDCDCSAAEPCPQGKTGSEARCKIWRRP